MPLYHHGDSHPGFDEFGHPVPYRSAIQAGCIVQKYGRELAYLEGTGTQYIDTGIPWGGYDWEVEFDYFPGTQCFFGVVTQGSGSSTWNCIQQPHWSNQASYSYHTLDDVAYVQLATPVRISCSDGFYIAGQRVANAPTPVYGANFTDVHILIYAWYDLNSRSIDYQRSSISSIKYSTFKIWRNGALVRNFIPVMDFNEVPCMYDKVSNAFFYNQGSGSFGYGELS